MASTTIEPYAVCFKRVQDYIIAANRQLRKDVLLLVNLILDSNYDHLVDIKKVFALPTKTATLAVLDNNKEIVERTKIKIVSTDDTLVIINKLLAKVNFYLALVELPHKTFYSIRLC